MEVINGHCMSLEVQTLDLLLPLYSLVPSFHLKYILWLKNFNLEVIKGCQKDKHWMRCCYLFPGSQLSSHMLKVIIITFLFLEVILGHQMVKHWIHCCYGVSWVPIFRLICIKPQLMHFYFGGHIRSLVVIRRSNTGFVDATVFMGFLAFN